MAKYGDLEARPDDGQNEFSDIIKSRSGEWWKFLLCGSFCVECVEDRDFLACFALFL